MDIFTVAILVMGILGLMSLPIMGIVAIVAVVHRDSGTADKSLGVVEKIFTILGRSIKPEDD